MLPTVATSLSRHSSCHTISSDANNIGFVGVVEEDFSPEAAESNATATATAIDTGIKAKATESPPFNRIDRTAVIMKSVSKDAPSSQSHQQLSAVACTNKLQYVETMSTSKLSNASAADPRKRPSKSMPSTSIKVGIHLSQTALAAVSNQTTQVTSHRISPVPLPHNNGWPASMPIVLSDSSKVFSFQLDVGDSAFAQTLRNLRFSTGKRILFAPLVVIDHLGERFVTWKSLMAFLHLSKTKKEKEAVTRKWTKSVADYKDSLSPGEDPNAFDSHTVTLPADSEAISHRLPERWSKSSQKAFNEDCVVSFIEELNEWLAQEKHREILHASVEHINEIRLRVFEGDLTQQPEESGARGDLDMSEHPLTPTTTEEAEPGMQLESIDKPVERVDKDEELARNALLRARASDPKPTVLGNAHVGALGDDVAMADSSLHLSSSSSLPNASTSNLNSAVNPLLMGSAAVSSMSDSDFLNHALRCLNLSTAPCTTRSRAELHAVGLSTKGATGHSCAAMTGWKRRVPTDVL